MKKLHFFYHSLLTFLAVVLLSNLAVSQTIGTPGRTLIAKGSFQVDSAMVAAKYQFKTVGETATDFTIPLMAASITLDTISVDKTVTFQNLPESDKGVVILVYNSNTSAFTWNISGNVIESSSGDPITELARGFHLFYWTGGKWIRMSTGSGGSGGIEIPYTAGYGILPIDPVSRVVALDTSIKQEIYLERSGDSLYVVVDAVRSEPGVYVPVSSTNIYNTNGIITSFRTVNLNGNGLLFQNLSGPGPSIFASGTGFEVQTNGTDPLIYGWSDNAANGGTARETFRLRTSGGTAAAGGGQYWTFSGSDNFYQWDMNKIKSTWVSLGIATPTSQLDFLGLNAGVEQNFLKLLPSYQIVNNLTDTLATRAYARSFGGGAFTNPLTTTGDMIISTSGSTAGRLGIGTAGQVLTTTSGLPAWSTPVSLTGYVSPYTQTATKNVRRNLLWIGASPFIGYQDSVWTGSWTLSTGTLVGFGAGSNNTGAHITAVGSNAGANNTGGAGSFFGYTAGQGNTGANTVGIGYESALTSSAAQSAYLGYRAGQANSGANSTLIGYQSGQNNAQLHVSALGHSSATSNTGTQLTAMGYQAGQSNSGGQSVLIGWGSGTSNSGANATGVGYQSLTGNTATTSAGVGYQALISNSGTFSDGIGGTVLGFNNGNQSIAHGYRASLYNNWATRTSLGFQAGLTFNGATTQTFASANVSGTTITITAHGFGTVGAKVNLKYNLLTGTTVTGLTDGNVYQFTIATANTLTYSGISGAGSGTYNLQKDIDKTGSIELGANSIAEKAHQFITATDITESRLYGALKIDSFSFSRIVIEGDSYSDLGDWMQYVSDSSFFWGKASYKTYAIAGSKTSDVMARYAAGPHVDAASAARNNYWYVMYCGINDLNNNISADSIYRNLKSIWLSARNDGYKVMAFTVIKRNAGTAQEAALDSLNALILSDQSYYDLLVDEAAALNIKTHPGLSSDNLHLNTGGLQMFAAVINNTIKANMYSMSSVDGDSAIPRKFQANINPAGPSSIGGVVFSKGLITTTGATPTTVQTIAIADESAGVLEITIVGRANGSGGGVTGKKIVRYIKDGGTLTLGSPTVVLADEASGSLSTASWTVTTSGNNVIVQATSVAATTVFWKSAVTQTPL